MDSGNGNVPVIEEGMMMENMDLARKTGKLGMLIHRYYMAGARRHGYRENPLRGQGRVLALLSMKPETTQKELSYLLDMRQQSLSELLVKLEEKGFIERSRSDEDARVTKVVLTDAGREAAPDLEAANKEADAFDCLDEAERAKFEELVDKLNSSLEGKLAEFGVDVRPPRPPRERMDRMERPREHAAERRMKRGHGPEGFEGRVDGPERGHGRCRHGEGHGPERFEGGRRHHEGGHAGRHGHGPADEERPLD